MFAIKRCQGIWAAAILGVCRRVEPQAQVIGLRPAGRRVLCCIWEWRIVKDERGRRDTGGDDEAFNAEASPKVLNGLALIIGFEAP